MLSEQSPVKQLSTTASVSISALAVNLHDVEKCDLSALPEYSRSRKAVIVFVVSWLALSITFSSTATFTATNEIASGYMTTIAMIDTVNSIVLIAMGVSPMMWVPLSKV